MNDIIVSMHDICKSFPGVKALDHVDFELRSGEVMALLGENGAGKSTLMKVLSGVYTRDSGDMEIQGKAYGNLTPKQAKGIIATMAQAVIEGNSHYYVTLQGDSSIYDFPLPGMLEIVAYSAGDEISFTYIDAGTTAFPAQSIDSVKTAGPEQKNVDTTV